MKQADQPYSLTETELRALASLAEAERVVSEQEPNWPGWRFADMPIALTSPHRRGYYLVYHGDLQPEAAEEVAEGVLFVPDDELPPDNRAVVFPLQQRPVGWIPLRWVGRTSSELQEFILRVCRLSFAAYFQERLQSQPNTGPDVDEDDGPAVHPEDTAICHALSRLEAVLLAESMEEQSLSELTRLAKAFCLVRRERRVHYSESQMDREIQIEWDRGLGLYIECQILQQAAARRQKCHPILTTVTGMVYWKDARPLLRARLRGLRLSALASDYGLRKRLPYLALGEALLLDRMNPDWKSDAGYVPMEFLLERQFQYSGEQEDDELLRQVYEKHDLATKLEEESARLRVLRKRRQKIEQQILQSPGTLLTVDVSSLALKKVEQSQSKEEMVNEHLCLHEGDIIFHAGETRLEFQNCLVLEDREHWLLQIRTPYRELQLLTERGIHRTNRKAAFQDGFELELPGIRIQARQGYVQAVEGGLYIKIER